MGFLDAAIPAKFVRVTSAFGEFQRYSVTSPCICCSGLQLEELLETPRVPVSNDYHAVSESVRALFSLRLAVCRSCGLVQLVAPPSPDIVRPRSRPVLYNEPESHLDTVVADIRSLTGVRTDTRFIGLSYKEDTTFERLNRLGYGNTYRLDTKCDYAIGDSAAGLETIQAAICAEQFSVALKGKGPAQVIVARHILEHAHDPRLFLAQLSNNLAPDGYLVFEVPDCSRAFAHLDYTTLWEEHISYFTLLSLENLFTSAGLSVVSMKVHPQPYEDSIVAIVRRGAAENLRGVDSVRVEHEVQQARHFSVRFESRQKNTRALIEKKAPDGCHLFGAGHLATMFVHLTGIQPFVLSALDDASDKVGKALPGTTIPIQPSDTLLSAPPMLCLLSLNPANESLVIERFTQFVARQGSFLSIFPSSNRSLHPLLGSV
jgi:hypothetical protein